MVQSSKDYEILQQLYSTSMFLDLQSRDLNIFVNVYVTKEESIFGQPRDTLSIYRDESLHNTSYTSSAPTVLTSNGNHLWMMFFIVLTTVITTVVFGALQQYVRETQRF